MTSQKKITLKSSDVETFEVEESVAVESQTIKHMIEDDCADNVTPLPNVTSKILAKVIEYCKKHVETPKTEDRTAEEEIKAWYAEFVKVDQATLFDLILKLRRSVVDMNTCISTNVNGVREGQQKKVKILLHKLIVSKQQS